jgi:hypothetical protein
MFNDRFWPVAAASSVTAARFPATAQKAPADGSEQTVFIVEKTSLERPVRHSPESTPKRL